MGALNPQPLWSPPASVPSRSQTPLTTPNHQPAPTRTPTPNDHVRAIVELLRPGTPDLARRWLAALLIVPEEEREAVVSAIERRIVAQYPLPAVPAAGALGEGVVAPAVVTKSIGAPRLPGTPRQVNIKHPPVQKQGYVEEVIRTYEVVEEKPGKVGKGKKDQKDQKDEKVRKRRRAGG